MKAWTTILILGFLALPVQAQMKVGRRAMYSGAPVCGDAIKNGSDQCDTADFGTDTCATYSCSGGTLTCTGACIITLGSCTGCTGTPNLLNEAFAETAGGGNDGYDVAGWTAAGSGGTTDPDATCPAGTGFTTQCLSNVTGSSGSNPYAGWDAGVARSGVTYCSAFMDLASTGAWGVGQDQTVLTIDSVSTTPSAFTATVFIEMFYYADATADPDSPDCSAYPCVRLAGHFANGTAMAVHPEITINAVHKLRIKTQADTSNCEMYLDGTAFGTGQTCAITGTGEHGAWQYIRVGQVETSKAAETFYFDNFKCSDTAYVD